MNALIGQMTLSGLPKIMCGLLKAYYKINLGGGGGSRSDWLLSCLGVFN